jgi:SAM-dependent methyltransferase/polyhydroxyalkanoate synthesis regulator phasin
MAFETGEVDVSDAGERVVGTVRDYNYYSHLSIYRFALEYLQGKYVLDCGCGTGYGTEYLTQNGAARAVGADYSEKAVEFATRNFGGELHRYQQADLGTPFPFPDQEFECIFSSNAMEHIGPVDTFFRECTRVLRSDGTMVFAVPAIVNKLGHRSLEENIWNIHHITNLTPLGWYAKACRYFEEVTPFSHWVAAHLDGPWERICADLRVPAEQNKVRERDFVFEQQPIEALNKLEKNLDAVFVARGPRAVPLGPCVDEFIPQAWAEGQLQSQIRKQEVDSYRQQLTSAQKEASESKRAVESLQRRVMALESASWQEVDYYRQQLTTAQKETSESKRAVESLQRRVMALESSASWRVTAPLRSLRRLLGK